MTIKILPYKMGSEGAKALSEALNIYRLYVDGRSRYRFRPNDKIINWGYGSALTGRLSVIPQEAIVNTPQAVANAANKLTSYQMFLTNDVPTCTFTSDRHEAQSWLNEETGRLVYARTKLSGSCGAGIKIYDPAVDRETPVCYAPLYTLGFDAKREYRVHVMVSNMSDLNSGKVIDYVKKGKRRDRTEEPTPLIRNHENGWVFMRDEVELPDEVADAAIKAVKSLGLHFGAVDIGYSKNAPQQKVCVYEVNTAPGHEVGSTTTRKYTEAFKALLQVV